MIRSNIDLLDNYKELLASDPEDTTIISASERFAGFDTSIYDQYRELGSSRSINLSQISEDLEYKDDEAFDRFRIKLGKFMTRFLPVYGIPLPDGKAVSFKDESKVRQ